MVLRTRFTVWDRIVEDYKKSIYFVFISTIIWHIGEQVFTVFLQQLNAVPLCSLSDCCIRALQLCCCGSAMFFFITSCKCFSKHSRMGALSLWSMGTGRSMSLGSTMWQEPNFCTGALLIPGRVLKFQDLLRRTCTSWLDLKWHKINKSTQFLTLVASTTVFICSGLIVGLVHW